MVQTKSTALSAQVGEEIGRQLGAEMISSYRSKNPNDVVSYFIGRNILSQILVQPGCIGIKFYNAYNEEGQKTLVYVGVDQEGNDMLNITSINTKGQLESYNGIVADRTKKDTLESEDSWWEF
ncbi:MAG: hypothetical protein ICV79_08980 [Flavisolibacter sp.]|nr:hypothetical protein [Flavisolibacter sp.]